MTFIGERELGGLGASGEGGGVCTSVQGSWPTNFKDSGFSSGTLYFHHSTDPAAILGSGLGIWVNRRIITTHISLSLLCNVLVI